MRHAEPSFDADLLVLGGGCAGLSLATRLATGAPALRTMVIEPRTHYVEDRTWCGWRTSPHPYTPCVAASWPRWRLIHAGRVLERGSRSLPYEMIPADRFYQHSLNAIQSNPSVCLAAETSAESVTEEAHGVTTRLADGRVLRSRWAVDTRPPLRTRTLAFPSLWQNFVGYEIQADPQWTARLGTTPVLMDFQPARTAAIQFLYLLPLGNHRFLCEWTRFSPIFGETTEIEADLMGWLEERGCTAPMIGRRESGSLPMSVTAPPSAPTPSRIVAAGTLGGSMRASTGYAFHSIQRWADSCAASLAAGKPPVAPARSPTLDFLDEVFLAALQDRSTSVPATAETLFFNLFERTDPDRLVRFLSGVPQKGDLLPVMASLPWLRFSKAALTTLLRKGAA